MIRKIRPSPRLRGEVTPPSDKSISHRAILLNSIARGEAMLSNFGGMMLRQTMRYPYNDWGIAR